MIKVSFVSTNKSSWGGSEYLWYQTALRFIDKGHNVSVSIPRWKDIPDALIKFKEKGLAINYNTDSPAFKKLMNRFLPKGLQYNYQDDGYRFLNETKPDLVVINQGGNTGGIELMEFCIGNNFKFVTIAQAANEAKWPTDSLNKRLSAALPRAVMNYFVSRANIKLTEIQIGQKIINSKIIFNPFNVSYHNEPQYPQIKESYHLANVARHEFYAKGQDILFEVLNENKWRERNLNVRLYGKGEHSYSLEKLKKFFDLKNVSIEGHIDPADIWKKNHALILTSRYEGLPLALVESMLCARMGIVTAVSGNPEVVADNENGFLAKAPTPEFVDEALERAWLRRDEWEAIGKKARLHIARIVPEDPIKYFYDELLSAAGS